MKNKTIWSILVLAGFGLADSIYLFIYKLSNNTAMCLGNGGCATVNVSRYSELYGIPVSLLGIFAYLAIIILLLLELRNFVSEDVSILLVFGVSLVGILFSAYLTYIEYFVIYAVCPFCVASAVITTILFILSSIRLVRNLNR